MKATVRFERVYAKCSKFPTGVTGEALMTDVAQLQGSALEHHNGPMPTSGEIIDRAPHLNIVNHEYHSHHAI